MEKKKKSKRSKPQDRLSELPDSLIFCIFEFLPMKYVVRTQILSHRWKNLWTLTPYLYFVNENANHEFRNLVNRCLLGWRGTRVQKFNVSGCNYKDSLYSDVDLWVRFAVDNGVEELDIYYHNICFIGGNHFVPQCLYSCSSLRKLWLEGISMDVRGNVEWNKLKSLTITGYEVTGHAINQILCGSPNLEVFILFLEQTKKNSNLCFRSSSLKELHLCKVPGDHEDINSSITINSELEIWTPNVETLTISGIPYGKCLLMNVSSLTQATLSFYAPYIDISATKFDFLGRTLSQILPTIQHVEGLTLLDWCIKVLVDRKSKCLLSPLSNVMFLTLNGCFKEHEQILDLLEIFPKLKTLVIEEDSTTQYDATSKSKLKFKPNPSKLFLEELTTVNVTCTKHDFSLFPLIKSLLKYASKLEKMMFRVEGIWPPSSDTLFKASQELLRMPRPSPTVKHDSRQMWHKMRRRWFVIQMLRYLIMLF